jgi:AcrR family transcriptional regulator
MLLMSETERRDLRAEILAAARGLFIQQGYHGLAMRQIAEAVGVSKPALYYHFRDKEELFLAVVQAALDKMEGLLERAAAQKGGARQQIGALIHTILDQPAEQRAMVRLASQELTQLSDAARTALQESYRERFLQKIQAILQSGIIRGELRPVDPELATWTLLGMMYPYFYPAHAYEAPPPAKIAGQILDIYLDGVAQPGNLPDQARFT